MTFKYTDLGPGDLGCVPDDSYSQVDPDNDDNFTRASKVWNYLIDNSPCTDKAIADLLAGENISHIPWTPIMHELADAVNYVLTQEEK